MSADPDGERRDDRGVAEDAQEGGGDTGGAGPAQTPNVGHDAGLGALGRSEAGQETRGGGAEAPSIAFSYNVGSKAIYRSRDPIRNLKLRIVYKQVRVVPGAMPVS